MKAELYTTNQLSLLSRLDRREVGKRLASVSPAETAGGIRRYRLGDALPVLCQTPDNAALAHRILEHRERAQKSAAEMAEMEAAKMAGTLCLREDYISDMANGIALGVSAIEQIKSLTVGQKAEVFAALRSIKLPDLPE